MPVKIIALWLTALAILIAPTPATDVALTAELASAAPIPFQGARMRIAIKNNEKVAVKVPLQMNQFNMTVERPDHSTFGPINILACYYVNEPISSSLSALEATDPTQLEPGATLTQAFEIGLVFDLANPQSKYTVLFDTPGKYTLKIEYKPMKVACELRIDVRAPNEDETPAYEFLKAHRNLTTLLVGTTQPFNLDADLLADLRNFLTKAAATSYREYAYFAFARIYLKCQHQTSTENWVKAAELQDTQKELRRINLTAFPFGPAILCHLQKLYFDGKANDSAMEAILLEKFPDAPESIEIRAEERMKAIRQARYDEQLAREQQIQPKQ